MRSDGPLVRDCARIERAVKTISSVVAGQLCSGCGACAYYRPDDIRMVDTLEFGRRPVVHGSGAADREALAVCPGPGLAHRPESFAEGVVPSLLDGWGPVLRVYEGWAADETLRHRGSSGGAATALAGFCIERQGMHGALHIRAREDKPLIGLAVVLVPDNGAARTVRLAVGGIDPRPRLLEHASSALRGTTLADREIASAAEAAATEVDPMTDLQGSADYRREMLAVWVRRALHHLRDAQNGGGR